MPCKTPKCRRYANLNGEGYCGTCYKKQQALNLDTTPYPCGKCAKNCQDTNKCVQCDLCLEWYHIICVDIGEEAYRWLKKLPGSRWFCDGCNPKLETIMEKANSLEAETKVLKTDMNSVKDRLDKVEKKLQGSVHKEIGSAINERTDIERRKLNLIVFNLPEIDDPTNTAWDLPEKITKDIESVTKILEEELKIEIEHEELVIDARRLGGKAKETEPGKKPNPRPLKIVFKDMAKKREVLSAAKNLRKSANPIANKLFINPDLTEAQRKLDKELREKMWQRRSNGENVIIRRGEIVTTSHEVQKERRAKPGTM